MAENKIMSSDIERVRTKIGKPIIFLLEREYKREWSNIDNEYQHPDSINFYQWLNNHDIIDDDDLNVIMIEIRREFEEQ